MSNIHLRHIEKSQVNLLQKIATSTYREAFDEFRTDDSLEVERIHVSEKFHGLKVGQILFDYAFEKSKRERSDLLFGSESGTIILKLFASIRKMVLGF